MAEREEQALGCKLDLARRQLLHEQQQLTQVRDYSRDYTARIAARRQGLRAADFINDRRFLQQLSRAEQDQANAVQRWQRQLDDLKQQWREKHQYRKAVADWLERLRGAEELELDKREQQQLDELVLRGRER